MGQTRDIAVAGAHGIDLLDGRRQHLPTAFPSPVHGDGLVAIQNGIRPHRVVRLTLAEAGRRVGAAEVLAMGLPDLDEPTLAVAAGERLYVVGRSQWAQLGGGHGPPPEGLPPAVVLALRRP